MRWRVLPHVEWMVMGDELLILNAETVQYLEVDHNGLVLWELVVGDELEDGAAAEELSRRFRLDPDEAVGYVRGFVERLEAAGVIKRRA